MRMVNCPCCGAPVDAEGESVYPFDDGKIDNTEPGDNLLMIDAQPAIRENEYRLLIMCHACWHRLEGDNGPDMWTSQSAWENLNPVTPFDKMPPLSAQKQRRMSDGRMVTDWDALAYLEYLPPTAGEG